MRLARARCRRSRARKDQAETGEEPSGRGRGKGRGRGRGRGGTKRTTEELELKEPSAASSSVPKRQQHVESDNVKTGRKRATSKSAGAKKDDQGEHDETSEKPKARKQKKEHVVGTPKVL